MRHFNSIQPNNNDHYSAILPSLYVLALPNTHTIQYNIRPFIQFLTLLIFELAKIYNSPSKHRQFYRCSSALHFMIIWRPVRLSTVMNTIVKIFHVVFRFQELKFINWSWLGYFVISHVNASHARWIEQARLPNRSIFGQSLKITGCRDLELKKLKW